MKGKKQERVIYLVRHGRVLVGEDDRRCIGQIDVPLSDEGVRQAFALQAELSSKNIAAVFCSDLTRSIDTAKIICGGLINNIVIKPELREISMGEWEGKTFNEIAQCYPEQYSKRGDNIAEYRIPGAENFKECQERIITAFASITGSTMGNLIIVGHAGANRVLLCHILSMPLNNLFSLTQDYGCINILTDSNRQYRVKLLNGFNA